MKLTDIMSIKDNTKLANEFSNYISEHYFVNYSHIINRNDPGDNNMMSYCNQLGTEIRADKSNSVLNSNILEKALHKYQSKHPNLNQWIMIVTYWNRDYMAKAEIKPINSISHLALASTLDLTLDDYSKN